jgi:hypothetical protein
VDVWDYFRRREGEHAEMSLEPDRDFAEMFQAEAGSDDRRGRIAGSLYLTDTARIDLLERVVIRANDRPYRERYAYFLVIDGYEVWGEERHRTHNPPVHRHVGPAHERFPSEPIAFKKFVARAWEEVSLRAEAPLVDDEPA